MTWLHSQESATQQKVGIKLQMAAFQISKMKTFFKNLVEIAYYLTQWIFRLSRPLLLLYQG